MIADAKWALLGKRTSSRFRTTVSRSSRFPSDVWDDALYVFRRDEQCRTWKSAEHPTRPTTSEVKNQVGNGPSSRYRMYKWGFDESAEAPACHLVGGGAHSGQMITLGSFGVFRISFNDPRCPMRAPVRKE